MARLHLDIPADLPFATEIDVRVTDLNYGNHLGNDAMLSLIHEARVRFLAHLGFNEMDVGGAAIVLSDAAIAYRAEAFLGDRLRFAVGFHDPARVGCDIVYRVTRRADDRLVAEAKTGIVFLDPATRRPTAIPDAVRAVFGTT